MKRSTWAVWPFLLSFSCTTQETLPVESSDAEGSSSNIPAAETRGLRPDIELLSFDPGPLPESDLDRTGSTSDGFEETSCTGRILSFTWNSAVQSLDPGDREIISVTGMLSTTELYLGMSWTRGTGEQRQTEEWQSLETGESLSHWQALLALPLMPRGSRLTEGMASQLTVVHEGESAEGCVRSGIPSETGPWIELDELIASRVDRVEELSSSREQVVFALENATDIRSVQLICISGWEDRNGVRNGRVRFEDVPRESCRVGWVGDRRGWVELPEEPELFRCVFETDSVVCDPL